MATGQELTRAQQWMEQTPGFDDGDEIVGLYANDDMDRRGQFAGYPDAPTYDGQPYPPELFYIDLREPVDP